MTTNVLRAQRAKLITDARAIVNSAAADMTGDQNAEFDRMIADADKLKATIDRMERADMLAAEFAVKAGMEAERNGTPHNDSVDTAKDAKALEVRLFKAMMLGAVDNLSDADRGEYTRRVRNAASVGSTTGGGFTVAPGFMAELLAAQKAFGGVRRIARVIGTETGVDMAWPTTDDTANVATIVAENTAGVVGTDLVFGSKTLKAWMYRSGYLPLSLEILQDSAFDFDTMVRDALAVRFARGQNAHFTTGDGTTQPQGVSIGGAVGRTGIAGQTLTVIFDDLMELEHSVDPAYRPGSVYMMHDASLLAIKKLKDTQARPLFVPGYTVGAPDRLLGYPIEINQQVAVMAANAKSIFFGNFGNYVVRDVMSLRVTRLNERFAENGQVAFIAFQRTDGRITSAGVPIKWYANSAT